MTPSEAIAAEVAGLPRWQQVARLAAAGYTTAEAALVLAIRVDTVRNAAHAARERHGVKVVWPDKRRGNGAKLPPAAPKVSQRHGMITMLRQGEVRTGRLTDMLASLPHDVQDWIMAGVGDGTICDAIRAIILDAHRDDMGG